MGEQQCVPPRRERGLGTIEERDGRFRVRLPRSSNPDRRSRTFDTREDAERFIRGAVYVLAQDAPDGGHTLASFGEGFLDQRDACGVRGIVQERSVWNNHVRGTPLAELPLETITRVDVIEWAESLRRKRALERTAWKKGDEGHRKSRRFLSRQARVHALRLVRRALQAAVDAGILAEHPAKDVRVASEPRSDDTWTFLTQAEIDQLLECEDVPQDERDLYSVAIHQGLREGELWGLRWPDVTLEGNRPEMVVRFSHRGPTKSGKVRRIPILEPARLALERWKSRCPKGTKNPEQLVFPGKRGGRRAKSNDAGWGDRVREKGTVRPGYKTVAGITRRVRFHDLRHTTASHLIMGTWGVQWTSEEIRDFLGHSDTKTTARYAHLSPDHLHRRASQTARRVDCGTTTLVPVLTEPVQNPAENPRRAMTDSNCRPLAPEANAGSNDSAPLRDVWDQRGTNLREAAREVLVAAATQGGIPADAVHTLASACLATPLYRHAAEVLAGGPHQGRRALELAAEVLRAVPTANARRA